ncbi:hypothetical protein [Bacillus cereus]|nr:hypothetical protein [Bacillus cereus]
MKRCQGTIEEGSGKKIAIIAASILAAYLNVPFSGYYSIDI